MRTATGPRAQATWHAGILLFEGFEPLEAMGPAQVLWALSYVRNAPGVSLPEMKVHLVAASGDPVIAAHGMVLHPTISFDGCPDLTLLVVAGSAPAPEAATGGEGEGGTSSSFQPFRGDPAMHAFIRGQAERGALVSSVCTGAFILAEAGLLAGRRATTHWFARGALVELMADRGEPFELVAERVVDDGAIVTGGGISSGIDLALRLVSRSFGQATSDAVARVIERQTPTDGPRR
jgi:cyclohexyl-isocyanide hydratase